MNLLLDTHIAIWALNDDPQLSIFLVTHDSLIPGHEERCIIFV